MNVQSAALRAGIDRDRTLDGRNRPDAAQRVTLAVLLVGVVLIAWGNAFVGPFVFDDATVVAHNPTIRHLWPLADPLRPVAGGATVAGRPLLNLSFALNYAINGENVVGYHAVNLAIHALAALTLLGLIWRLLERPVVTPRLRNAAGRIAFLAAALWSVHPLQTESVTYIAQRGESLASLFYLLTLYAVVRGAARTTLGWEVTAVAACVAGMLTKEIVVTAPVMAFLLDRSFIAGTMAAAWRRRRRLYVLLASTWLIPAIELMSHADRGGTAGFTAGVSGWEYAVTQCWAICHYLYLVIFPAPLVFDYGATVMSLTGGVLFRGGLVLLAVVLTGVALVRRPVLGFLGAWWFLLLAPSSSFVPIASQTIAEHRVYLALAAPIVALALALHQILTVRRAAAVMVVFGIAATAGVLARNDDYRSETTLWRDTVAKRPENPRAWFNLGVALERAGDAAGAIDSYRTATARDDRNAEVHLALGSLLTETGERTAALAEFQRALELTPDSAIAHFGLGNVRAAGRDWEGAMREYEKALTLRPDYAAARTNLANALLLRDHPNDVLAACDVAVRICPASAQAHYELANALVTSDRAQEAVNHYEAATKLDPKRADIQNDYGSALAQLGRVGEALPHFEAAVRLAPTDVDTRLNLANAFLALHRVSEARQQAAEAARLQPDNAAVRELLKEIQR